jgi:hypothetical protein
VESDFFGLETVRKVISFGLETALGWKRCGK